MEILYHDRQIAVCVKPVGMDAQFQLPEALGALLGMPMRPLYRLDKPVGGLMLCAATKEAAAELSRCIQEGGMEKEYVARVHGCPPESGQWRDLLWRDPQKNKVYPVKRMRGGVREARLEYVRLTQGQESLVRVRLQTGRTHQIRVQFASRGYPVAGDRKYGGTDGNPAPLLFCCKLAFPFRGERYCFEKLPDWAQTQPEP